MESNLKSILEQIEKEKGISSEEVFSMLESALTSAFEKHGEFAGPDYIANIDRETGKIRVFLEKKVVKKVIDSGREIEKTAALKINPSVQLGDSIQVEVPADKFGRIAAQTAKQIIMQKMRENERDNIYTDYKEKEGKIVTGTVYRFTNSACIIEIGKTEAILPEREQIRFQKLFRGDSIKVYIVEVSKSSKGPKILVSRTHPGLVVELFKLEAPEVADGMVEIKKIVRDPGIRCKVAVLSHNARVDPIGACVGINGVRVQSVINELGGERMDLIKYSEDIKEYIANSLSPAKVESVAIIDEKNKEARVVVSDEMLSLAIGKNGQNVRLAARLTNWHIDIQTKFQTREPEEKGAQTVNSNTEITSFSGIGAKNAKLLKEYGFDSIEKLKQAPVEELLAVPGIGPKTAEKILNAVKEE